METDHEQFLPDDLVLETVARTGDPAAIVRCAALSKPLRRAILSRPFLRLLVRRGNIAAAAASNRRRFIPSLLLGVYHRPRHVDRPLAFAPASAAAARIAASLALIVPPIDGDGGEAAGVFGPYTPLTSRRSLVVLRRRRVRDGGELTVCNAATGERWVIPTHDDVPEQSLVLLDVSHHHGRAGTRSSFKLLAANLPENSPRTLTVQVFSSSVSGDSDGGAWGPPLACAISRPCELHCPATKPVVLRGAVHWLCATSTGHRILKLSRRGGDAPKASLMNLPPPFESGLHDADTCLALSSPAAADDGRRRSLSVLVLRRDGGIDVWVRAIAGGGARRGEWEQRHVIREDGVARGPMDLRDGWLGHVRCLEWFCEGSGALIMEGRCGSRPLLLDMDGMAVKKFDGMVVSRRQAEFCPYELDLISYMMFVMNPF